MTPRDERARRLAPALALCAGLLLAFHPALLSGFGSLQIRSGDPTLVHYILEHTWRWLVDAPLAGSLWDPPCYVPSEGVSARSDVMVGTAPLYWGARALGAAPGPAFQVWMMLGFALAFAAAHLFLRRHASASPSAAATGAFIAGFGSARLANFNSPQLFAAWPGLFALLFLGNALAAAGEGRRGAARGWVAATGAACVVQGWSAFYPSVFLALAFAAALLAGAGRRDTRRSLRALGREWHVVLGVMAAAALALAPLALRHIDVAVSSGARSWEEVALGLPVPASWVFTGGSHWLYGDLAGVGPFRFDGPPGPHANGVGWITSLVALGGLWSSRERAVARVAGGAALLVILVTTRWGGAGSLWSYVYDVLPGADAVRYLARVGQLLALPAAIGVALALDSISRRRSARLAMVLAAFVALEQGHALGARDEARFRWNVSAVAARVPADASAFLLTTSARPPRIPVRRESRRRQVHLLAMWAALEAGVPTVNGFYGLDPAGWPFARPFAPDARARAAMDALVARSAPPGTALVHLDEALMPWFRRADEERPGVVDER